MVNTIISRRQFASLASLTIGSCVICPDYSLAKQQFELGCSIDEVDLKGLKAARKLIGLAQLKSLLKSSSGNKNLDSTLETALSYLSNDFGVYPAFFFFNEGSQRNAQASRSRLNTTSDGTVLFGTTMLKKALEVEGGDAAILAICAHEFAHIAAFKREDMMVKILTQTPSYAGELHADFLSGYFLSKYSQRFPALNLAAIGTVWLTMGSRLPSRPGTHGTVEMRRQAINAGYFFADGRSDVEFELGFEAANNYILKL